MSKFCIFTAWKFVFAFCVGWYLLIVMKPHTVTGGVPLRTRIKRLKPLIKYKPITIS